MNKTPLIVFSAFLCLGLVSMSLPTGSGPVATTFGSPAEATSWVPTIAVSLGVTTGGIDDFPPDPAARHSRDECPYDNWITHGDGHKTRCPYCDPPWDQPAPSPDPDPPETRCQCEQPGYYCACEEEHGKCQCPRIPAEKKSVTSSQQQTSRRPGLFDALFRRSRFSKECST